ncbi:hypothetical protein [Krasilnikovia sp. MM14-A1259]|uniref:hypothetical protein n=1 Tax=Krasilnikovia sp. MM14-A1259 TaxID=3373539 RepID=UPI003823F752
MTYQHNNDLYLTYSPARGYWNFVLYVEPSGPPVSAINAGRLFWLSTSRYATEWRDRLIACTPNALHVMLAGQSNAPELWHPCVYDDPQSPAAIGDGCDCWKTFYDPVTGLPVAANHELPLGRAQERWQYHTYAPLSLPENERLTVLVIDRETGLFWVRTDHETLQILPERQSNGYEVGYRGGGPTELARMIEKIVRSDGQDVSAGTPRPGMPDKKVLNWVSSAAADRTQEFTLDQLKLLCRSGMVA